MWAWAALLGGLAVVLAADLVGGSTAIERREFSRSGSETTLDRRDQRALALARNFATWHQAATAVARSGGVAPGEIDEAQIKSRLPASYYNKAGPWRSVLDADGTVRTTDDGTSFSGVTIGGSIARFVAAATGYAGLGGLAWHGQVAETRPEGALALPFTVTAADGRGIRVTPPDSRDPADRNVP